MFSANDKREFFNNLGNTCDKANESTTHMEVHEKSNKLALKIEMMIIIDLFVIQFIKKFL